MTTAANTYAPRNTSLIPELNLAVVLDDNARLRDRVMELEAEVRLLRNTAAVTTAPPAASVTRPAKTR